MNRALFKYRWWLFGALILLRIIYAYTLRVDSDEPQHLHVVWAWAQGLLPFRDVFDNHMQLFQLINYPFLSLIGENADVVVWMRLLVIPWYLLLLWCTYRIGVKLYSREVGIWAASFCSLYPRFFELTTEFRPDNAWAAVWLLMLMTMIEGELTYKRGFLVGLITGAAFAISIKTTLLLATLLLAALATIGLLAWEGREIAWHRLIKNAMAALIGLLLVPGAIVLFFVYEGSWQALWYGAVEHNLVPGLGRWQHLTRDAFIFPLTLVPSLLLARAIVQRSSTHELGVKRALIFLGSTFYLACLWSYWPLFTHQDLLPFLPLAMICTVALIFYSPVNGRWLRPASVSRVFYFLLFAECICLIVMYKPWLNKQKDYANELGLILKLTDPGDSVMDSKGETVFRHRPFYFALETITLKRMELGLIADDIPQRLIATATPVVVPDRLSPTTLAFVEANYLPITPRIFVAGQRLVPTAASSVVEFDIRIPTRYQIVDEQSPVIGLLDGSPYHGARELVAGHHVFVPQTQLQHAAIIWSQATERGFSLNPQMAPGN